MAIVAVEFLAMYSDWLVVSVAEVTVDMVVMGKRFMHFLTNF